MSGPIPFARCTICSGTLRGYIDTLVTAGTRSKKSIAAETGVSYAALRRHSANHVAPRSSAVAPTVPMTPLSAGASPLDSMRRRLDVLNAMDESTMSSRDRIQHSEELRRAAETLARMEPPSKPEGVSFAEVDGLAEFFADIAGLAARFPLIQPDLLTITRKHFPMEGT